MNLKCFVFAAALIHATDPSSPAPTLNVEVMQRNSFRQISYSDGPSKIVSWP